MRIFRSFATAVAIGILFAGAASAQSATLTAKMAPFNYLLGTAWTCNVSVPAMMGQPAHTEKSTVTFDAAPNNAMHVHIVTQSFTGDQYFGYSTRQNVYWSTSANSMGQSLTQTSSDGKNYTGSAAMGPTSVMVHDTYSKIADNHMTFQDTAAVNGQNYVTNGDCTR
jgi:hypothetical protein